MVVDVAYVLALSRSNVVVCAKMDVPFNRCRSSILGGHGHALDDDDDDNDGVFIGVMGYI